MDEEWSEALEAPTMVSPSINNRLSQLYILHRSYLTPTRLFRMGRLPHSTFHRCSVDNADLWHLIWECRPNKVFWTNVLAVLSKMVPVEIPLCPKLCILGIIDDESWSHHDRIFLRETLFLARQAIALRWMGDSSPSLEQ